MMLSKSLRVVLVVLLVLLGSAKTNTAEPPPEPNWGFGEWRLGDMPSPAVEAALEDASLGWDTERTPGAAVYSLGKAYSAVVLFDLSASSMPASATMVYRDDGLVLIKLEFESAFREDFDLLRTTLLATYGDKKEVVKGEDYSKKVNADGSVESLWRVYNPVERCSVGLVHLITPGEAPRLILEFVGGSAFDSIFRRQPEGSLA